MDSRSVKFKFLPVRLVSIFLLVSVSFGCSFFKRASESATVVQVNSHKLSIKDFSQKLAIRVRDLDALSVQNKELIDVIKSQIIEQFILESLVLDAAKQARTEATEDEIQKAFSQASSEYPDDLSFRNMLVQESLSIAEFRERIRYQLTAEKFFKSLYNDLPEISTKDVEAYYKENSNLFKSEERVFIRQIVAKDLTQAMEVLEQLKKGQSFDSLARKFSQTPEATEGGVVGWIEKSTLNIFEPLFSAPLNQTQGPTESPYGFHIMRAERKAPAGQRPLKEVEALIKQQLRAAQEEGRFKTWLERQVRMSIIRKDQDRIDAIKAIPKLN